MTTSNDFSEYYKSISNTELLSILDNPQDYQPLAVEAAKAEFSNRQLSATAIQEARQPLIVQQIQKEKEREKIKAVETKIKAAGHSFFDTINPIQTGIPSTEKTLRFIVIVFGSIFLYQFIGEFGANMVYIKEIPRFPFASISILFPKVLLLVATIAFWKRKKVGWTLLMVFITFSAVAASWLIHRALNWKPSGNDILDTISPRPALSNYISQLLFLVGTTYVLCKANIREVFSVDKEKMTLTIVLTGLLSLMLVIVMS